MRVARRRLLLATLSAAALAACGRKPKLAAVPAGSTVLALGDSITFGVGATPETSYPAVLAKLTGWQIVNAGISGDTSAGALARLAGLLQEHSPRLVLVSIGGNDFLRRMPLDQTRDNVRRICQLAAAGGAQVLLVAIPAFSAVAAVTGSLNDHAMFEELGNELKVPVHAKGWAAVLSDPALRADPIHANERGYALFAQGLVKTVQDIGFFQPQ
ncbi:GDSL-type esterase/lipase family protein [Ramlibacter sp. WS9]|uniref:GDSL-type esterase/lipase family protein n=1 Tax=Ramlibacter sp. WS9 TaxID=1882741 RepID=UPI001143E7C7|nr:GDSL-type esterase/lipase family protein [Ramlibacter sp. WS9]ROZ69365.1 arylesterase [Ramlibacter sp. WS9]